jgi:hypothetical protein
MIYCYNLKGQGFKLESRREIAMKIMEGIEKKLKRSEGEYEFERGGRRRENDETEMVKESKSL